jgi:hypothetical protein
MTTKRKSPAVPPRVVELTLVGTFARPGSWGRRGTPQGDEKEWELMQAKTWHPCTEDFQEVANVPNTQRKLTTVFNPIRSIGDFLGAILDLGASGGEPRRPKRSIKRLNLISHGLGASGVPPIYGLSGEIAADGGCSLFGSLPEHGDPNRPMNSRGIDEALIEWLDTTAKDLRDQCRERFREDGEIGLVLCNSGGNSFALNVGILRGKLENTFQTKVRAYDDEIVYHAYHQGGRFVRRNHTSIGMSGAQGAGYFCAVSVPDALAGKHLKFNVPR